MAALDFPASPATGDKYPVTPIAGQPQYTYDGEKWTTVGAQITNAAAATAAPLMDAAVGLVGTAGKYAREDHVHPKIYAAPFDAMAYSGMQVNGGFDVNQEGVSATANQKYFCDGWQLFVNGAMVVGAAAGPTVPAGLVPGLPNLAALSVTVAAGSLAAGDYVAIAQYIEGYRIARLNWGYASAQPITLGFWSAHARTGLYSGSIRNGTSGRSYVFTYTQAAGNAPQYNTITIPGDTAGTWAVNNAAGMVVTFAVATGSTLTAPSANTWLGASYHAAPGQVNGVAATSDVFRLWGVVVLPGIEAPSAARSPLIMRPYDQELLTCMRYFCNGPFYGPSSRWKVGLADGSYTAAMQWPTVMRAAPTLGQMTAAGGATRCTNGEWAITAAGGANGSRNTSIDADISPTGASVGFWGPSGQTTGPVGGWGYTTANLSVDARL